MRRRAIVAIGNLVSCVPYCPDVRSMVQVILVAAAALSCPALASAEALPDRLDTPAVESAKSRHGLLNAVVSNGPRLVTAGQRGHILLSDDAGGQWTQATVPVRSDLTALHFADASHGWAVGHDGVVLATTDGGETWALQLDGRRIADLLAAHVATLDAEQYADAIGEIERSAGQGADQSLLDVHFVDASNGYVVGANNLVLATQDGGAHWTPLSERVDNPRALHLYGVAEAFGRVVIVGEQGLILSRTDEGRFERIESPYQGSWFGLLGTPDRLLVYGLRGNAWSSTDAGATWQRAELDSGTALTAADITPQGNLLLTGLGGEVFRSTDGGARFDAIPLANAAPFAAIAAVDDTSLVVAGVRGVQVLPAANGAP